MMIIIINAGLGVQLTLLSRRGCCVSYIKQKVDRPDTSQMSLLTSENRSRDKKKKGPEEPLGIFVDNYLKKIDSLPMLKMAGTTVDTIKGHFKLNCLVFFCISGLICWLLSPFTELLLIDY